LLDTVRTIETPEGVSIRLRLAGPVPRALAWLLDFCIRFIVWLVTLTILEEVGNLQEDATQIAGAFLFFLFEWFYPVLYEVLAHGATPGKKALGLTVLQDDGVPVGWSASVTRNLLRFVDFLPVLYAFGLYSMFLNRDFKRLGDIVAKTIVVHQDRPTSMQKLPQGSASPLPVWLSSSEQQLIVTFATRVPRMAPDRAQELAQILEPANNSPLRAHTALHANVDSLLGYARHIVGER